MQKLHPVVVVHGQVPLDSRTTYTTLTDCSAVLFRHHLAPSNIKYLHVLLLTEQSLLAATEQSLWAAMLSRPYPVEAPPLAPSSIQYLPVLLLTRKPFLAAMLTSVVSCFGTVPGSQQHQVHLHLFWFTRKTILAAMSTSVFSCLGTIPGSQQHQIPSLRAASEPASHPSPAAKPDSHTCEHLPPRNQCRQQPPYVWPSPRSIWRQQKVFSILKRLF